jgi:hypothetical protein
MKEPTFLVIGDTKAGTTSLHSYLRQHPDVFVPPKPKELRYFSFDEDNAYHRLSHAYRVRTYADYLSYFANSGAAGARGEASPQYLRAPGAAERIFRHLPRVKIVACLRNPAERLLSLYQMQRRSGTVSISLDECLFSQNATWIKGNFLWADLQHYFRLFSRDQILIQVFDDLVDNTPAAVSRLYAFLDVQADFTPDYRPENTGGSPSYPRLYPLMLAAKNAASRLGLSQPALKSAWKRINRSALSRERLDPAIRDQILAICRDDILRTQDLVQRDLSRWLNRA